MSQALRVEQVSKRFAIGASKTGLRQVVERALHNPLTLLQRPNQKEFWALKDLNFEVEAGSRVGIVGRNGAGKSTLLKLISKVTPPTHGRIEITGRVGSLLEVGTGFHPELTGRENIFLNGALLGMKRREIQKSFDEIVAFSEVEKFIDTPVKHYSSGMYVRLAFAVAAHLRTEILIVDEVLAVGDSRFQKKCIEKMNEVGRAGRTVLFVSHHLALVQSVCQQALLLEGGQQKAFGTAEAVLAQYQKSSSSLTQGQDGWVELQKVSRAHSQLQPCLSRARLRWPGHTPHATPGDTIEVEIEAHPLPPTRELAVLIRVQSDLGATIFTLSSLFGHGALRAGAEGLKTSCRFVLPPLRQGTYGLSLELYAQDTLLDEVNAALTLEVDGSDYLGHGYYTPPHHGPLLVKGAWSD